MHAPTMRRTGVAATLGRYRRVMATDGRRSLKRLGLAALTALAAGCASAGGAHTPVAFPSARPVVSPAETEPFVAAPWVPDGVVRAETEEEALRQVAQHARDKHGVNEVTPEMVAKVREVMKEE